MLLQIEHITTSLSEFIWPLFLPVLLVLAVFVGYKTIFVVKNKITQKGMIKFSYFVGPVSISLGAMVGTGAIIGVLGSLSKLNSFGQMHIEAMSLWAVIGGLILVPLNYSETMVTKITKSPPHQYLSFLISPLAGKVYGLSFVTLYIFGFGGFQFSGIDTAITIINTRFFDINFSEPQRYLFIVVPLIIFLASIVLIKKHNIFINALSSMIGAAVIMYFVFVIFFFIKTANYFDTYLANIWIGFTNPVSMMLGVPTGLILGFQRIIQTSETGLGALGMASLEADSKAREAGIISIIPTVITIFVALIVTNYITSYGYAKGFIILSRDGVQANGIERLTGFFNTAIEVTGDIGLFVMLFFTILSGVTTLLGSYYFLGILTNLKENQKILAYLVLITSAGTLAVFGFTIIFDVVDLLLFVVISLNVTGLAKFMHREYRQYKYK